jgi:hypothetical protein
MGLARKLGIIAVVVLAIGTAGWFVEGIRSFAFLAMRGAYFAVHPVPSRCKERAAQFKARVELLQKDAETSLKIGATKDDVLRFFAARNIPVTFDKLAEQQHAVGTAYFKGSAECENFACGDDAGLIGIRVGVNSEGTVVSEPVVTAMLTNCL